MVRTIAAWRRVCGRAVVPSLAASAVLAAISCGPTASGNLVHSLPTAPSSAAEPSNEIPPPLAIRGTDISTMFGFAYEHTAAGIHPLADFPLRVRGYRSEPSAYTPVTIDVLTDSGGRYEVPRMMREFAAVTIRSQEEYLLPCSARVWTWRDSPINVHVVSRKSFLESGMPSSMPPLSKRVGDEQGGDYNRLSGVVTESTPAGLRPVAGALVQHFYGNAESGELSGYTLTNVDGSYSLCGYYDDYGKVVKVTKKGYRPALQELVWPLQLDFELVRE